MAFQNNYPNGFFSDQLIVFISLGKFSVYYLRTELDSWHKICTVVFMFLWEMFVEEIGITIAVVIFVIITFVLALEFMCLDLLLIVWGFLNLQCL